MRERVRYPSLEMYVGRSVIVGHAPPAKTYLWFVFLCPLLYFYFLFAVKRNSYSHSVECTWTSVLNATQIICLLGHYVFFSVLDERAH